MITAELIAVQAHVRLGDYADEAAYRRKVEALFERVDGARARTPDGGFAHPALVVFPENFGTFLCVADRLDLVQGARTTDDAIARIALRRLPALAATAARLRLTSPTRAVLALLAARAWEIHHRTFREAARRHRAWVVAGTLLCPRNRLGLQSDRFEPLDGRIYNLSLAFGPDGRVVNESRKVNLVPTQEDVLGLTPGRRDDLRAFDTDLGRVGTMICYDGFHEAHTDPVREPGFLRIGPHYARQGVRILAQPAANPWPWTDRWVFAEPGEDLSRDRQWLDEGLCTQLRDLPGVRYAVNPQLIGEILDHRFEGRSFVFARHDDGEVGILARSGGWALEPASEEIVLARVDVPRA